MLRTAYEFDKTLSSWDMAVSDCKKVFIIFIPAIIVAAILMSVVAHISIMVLGPHSWMLTGPLALFVACLAFIPLLFFYFKSSWQISKVIVKEWNMKDKMNYFNDKNAIAVGIDLFFIVIYVFVALQLLVPIIFIPINLINRKK